MTKDQAKEELFEKQIRCRLNFNSYQGSTFVQFRPARVPWNASAKETPSVSLSIESILGNHATEKMCYLIFFLRLNVRQYDSQNETFEEIDDEFALVQELEFFDLSNGRARQKQPQLEAAAFLLSLLSEVWPNMDYLYYVDIESSGYYHLFGSLYNVTAIEQRSRILLSDDSRQMIRYGVAETELPSVAGGRTFLSRSGIERLPLQPRE